ncbi:MAG: hypothetical protein HYY01_00695 [Chloroflexi bacterium]|nr:hypothetical protein [Chloroflexota bacterium]
MGIDVQAKIESLGKQGFGATQILKKIQQESSEGTLKGDLPGDVRTVQRIVKDARGLDPSGPWVIADQEDGRDVQRILTVLREATSLSLSGLSPGEVRVTNAEARWVLWLCDAAPGLPPPCLLLLARIYVIYRSHDWDTAPLDFYLLYAPWDFIHGGSYVRDIDAGKIPPVPFWLQLVEGVSWRQGPFAQHYLQRAGAGKTATEVGAEIDRQIAELGKGPPEPVPGEAGSPVPKEWLAEWGSKMERLQRQKARAVELMEWLREMERRAAPILEEAAQLRALETTEKGGKQ